MVDKLKIKHKSYFRSNSSVLTEAELVKIKDILSRNIQRLKKIKITGFTDQVGDEDSNFKLLENGRVKKEDSLAIIYLIAIVIRNGMKILGVSLPEKM